MRIFFTLTFIAAALTTQAQKDPVHLKYEVKKTGDKKFELHINANIDPNWHIYAQVQPEEAVASPTTIQFSRNPLILLHGKPEEIGKKEKYEDKNLNIIQYQYAHQLTFVQKMTLKATVKTNIAGTISYIACNDKTCLPEKQVTFSVPVAAL